MSYNLLSSSFVLDKYLSPSLDLTGTENAQVIPGKYSLAFWFDLHLSPLSGDGVDSSVHSALLQNTIVPCVEGALLGKRLLLCLLAFLKIGTELDLP